MKSNNDKHNNRINKLHERALRIVYKKPHLNFQDLVVLGALKVRKLRSPYPLVWVCLKPRDVLILHDPPPPHPPSPNKKI